MNNRPVTAIQRRSQLLSLLTEACELEHGLACSYLYAAFTLKQDLSEGGLDWRQRQRARFWAAQLYFVAAQEMLHLAQVWNLQAAIGGAPYYLRPNFPQPSKFYPLNLPLRLEPFGLAALERFIEFERPADIIALPTAAAGRASPNLEFQTVGELYQAIAEGFQTVPDLVIGEPARQVGPELVDFPDLIRVTTVDDALRAVDMITEQGEGINSAHIDCHFAIFRQIRRQYLTELAEAEPAEAEAAEASLTEVVYEPVRRAISNPVAGDRPELGAVGANPITDEFTMQVAGLFDSIYGHMLRMLQHVFDNATSHQHLLRVFGHGAIELMTTVIKPLGEALTRMPAGEQYEDQTAGPGFALARHVPLPTEPIPAAIVAAERFGELSIDLAKLADSPRAVAQLRSAAANLEQLAQRFARLPEEVREG